MKNGSRGRRKKGGGSFVCPRSERIVTGNGVSASLDRPLSESDSRIEAVGRSVKVVELRGGGAGERERADYVTCIYR